MLLDVMVTDFIQPADSDQSIVFLFDTHWISRYNAENKLIV